MINYYHYDYNYYCQHHNYCNVGTVSNIMSNNDSRNFIFNGIIPSADCKEFQLDVLLIDIYTKDSQLKWFHSQGNTCSNGREKILRRSLYYCYIPTGIILVHAGVEQNGVSKSAH